MKKALAALALVAAGCASTVEKPVKITTNAPPGSLKIHEGQRAYLVSGGGEVLLDPTRDHTLTLEAAGFKPAELTLTSHVSGLDVFYGICLGLPIFPLSLPIWLWLGSSGAWDCLEPSSPWVPLVAEGQ